jgi:methylmalonyl-CoA mutase
MDEPHKLNDFEAPSYEAWYELVGRDLKGAPFDKKLVKRVAGVAVKPLYTRADLPPAAAAELPGFAPYTRGGYALGGVEMGWDLRPELRSGSAAEAAQNTLDQLNGGATSLSLVTGEHGVAIDDLEQLGLVLTHVDLSKTPIALRAGDRAFAYAAGLIALAQQRGTKVSALCGCLGLDPLGTLAREGALHASLSHAFDQAAALAGWAGREAPGLRALAVDLDAYHCAGADAALEVALALATGVEYLRALSARGLSLELALGQLQFSFSVGRDFFTEIAKLRAARQAWARVASASGAAPEHGVMLLHARTSLRETTRRDPWVNLLRGTAESFAAAVAGADAITTYGFDAALGASDEFAERMARNTQHLLRHESNLHRVVDPAGGSFYVESLTEALTERAWAEFQAIEQRGGLTQALLDGSVQTRLKQLLEQDEKAVESRKIAITGVNEFPHVHEEPVKRAPARERTTEAPSAQLEDLTRGPDMLGATQAALLKGASFGDVTRALALSDEPARAPELIQRRLSAPLEALRDRADARRAQSGQRPRVFLANLGPIAEHKARAMYAQNYFEAGGFEVLSNDGFANADEAAAAFGKSGAELCALCSSDAVYAELAEATARSLAQAGARAVVLAGSPGDHEAAYRAAGVSDFIFVGSNLVTTLSGLLTRAGVP